MLYQRGLKYSNDFSNKIIGFTCYVVTYKALVIQIHKMFFFCQNKISLFSRLEMLTSLYNWRVAVKDRATRCSRDTILKNPWVPFLALVAILVVAATSVSASKEVATNSFYVKIHGDPDQPDLAHKIARRNGFHNLGPVSFFSLICDSYL